MFVKGIVLDRNDSKSVPVRQYVYLRQSLLAEELYALIGKRVSRHQGERLARWTLRKEGGRPRIVGVNIGGRLGAGAENGAQKGWEEGLQHLQVRDHRRGATPVMDAAWIFRLRRARGRRGSVENFPPPSASTNHTFCGRQPYIRQPSSCYHTLHP